MKKLTTLLIASIFITNCLLSQMSFTVDTNQGCTPLTVNFTNTSPVGPTYTWDFGDGSPIYTGYHATHTYYTGSHWVTLSNGGSATHTTIDVIGADKFKPVDGSQFCPGEEVEFAFEGPCSYTIWDFGDGIIDTSNHNKSSHIYNTPGFYDVTLIVDGECGVDTITQTYEVTNSAIPNVEMQSNNNQICPGDEVSFWSDEATLYYWDFDDGTNSTEQNPQHQFNTLGSKRVILTVTNICGNSNSDTVFINVVNNLEADASFQYNNPACPNGFIGFYCQNFGTYQWDFGIAGTSNIREPEILFTDTGTYPVQLIFTNGCGDTDTSQQDIIVEYDTLNKPNAQILFDINNGWGIDTIKICPNQEVKFRNETWSEGDLYFHWNFNDGNYSYSKDAIHTFTTTGLYEVVMTATNNCNGQDSVSLWVDVDPTTMPNSSLQAMPDTICPGESAFFYNEEGENDDDNTSYFYSIWFGDGDSIVNVTSTPDSLPFFHHTYDTPGSYDYTFAVSNLCNNYEYNTGTIVVDDSGNHETFYFTGNSADTSSSGMGHGDLPCPGDLIEFFGIGGASIIWDFGDGTLDTGMHVFHSYPDTGTYTILLYATDGCGLTDTLETYATVDDSSFADSWFDVDKEYACVGDTINFDYHRDGFEIMSYDFEWQFGDGTTSSYANPRHIYASAGDYFVKLIVTNGCGADSSIRMIRIDAPTIDFTVDQNIIAPSTTVNFTNLTTNATAYLWYFGDGTSSTLQNPSHTYTNFGSYNVTLIAASSGGCTDFLKKNNYIHVHNMEISYSSVNDITCNGDDDGSIDVVVTGGQYPYTYLWSNGGTSQHISNLPSGGYSVTITDYHGATTTGTYSIIEPPAFSGGLSKTDVSCFGLNDGFASISLSGGTPPYEYLWSNGETTSNVNNLVPDNYMAIAQDANGCIVNEGFIINEPAEIILNGFTSSWPSTCISSDASITVNATGGVGGFTYQWDANTGSQTGTTAIGLSSGAYTVTAYDSNSCFDVLTISVDDPAGPTWDWGSFGLQNVSCYNDNNGFVYITANGTPPLIYEWSTGSNDTIITNLTPGTYTLTVTDGNDCEAIFIREFENPDELVLAILPTNPTCYGGYDGGAQAFVSGGTMWGNYNYQWSNGSQDSIMVNRPAGNYSLTVTDGPGCTIVGNTTLTNPPQIIIDMYPSSVTFYGQSDGYIDIMVNNGILPYQFLWSNGETTEDIGGLSAGVYTVTIIDDNSCQNIATDTVHQPLALNVNITSSGNTTFCSGNGIILDAGAGYVDYQWSANANNATTRMIPVGTSGTYYVTVTSINSYGIGSITVDVKEPYANQEICIVTIDSTTGKNLVVWEKAIDEGIESFNIYKESTVSNVYDSIGNLPFDDMSEFIDYTSNPQTVAARYKISVVDTCGNESALSLAHKTMHLTVSTGLGVYNLIWENYEGFTFGSYTIFRGTDQNNLLPIGAIQSTLTTYTDYQPIGLYYYQISVEKTSPCIPTSSAKANGGPYSHSVSNLEDNGMTPTGIEQLYVSDDLLIYPNPFTNSTTIKFNNSDNSDFDLTLFDISGKIVKIISNINTGLIHLDRDELTAGFYTVELKGNKTLRGRIIIK